MNVIGFSLLKDSENINSNKSHKDRYPEGHNGIEQNSKQKHKSNLER